MKSFDQKYFLPDYIAYSGIGPVVQRALAFQNLEDYDRKSLTIDYAVSQTPRLGYVAQGGTDWVAPGKMVISEFEDFDDKGLIPLISYADWVAQQALAVSALEDYEDKFLPVDSVVSQIPRPAYVAHGGMDWVASDSLAMSELEDYADKGLPSVGLASQLPVTGTIDGLVAQRALEEFYKAQNDGLDSVAGMNFDHIDCWDRKFYLPGHVVCPDGPVAGEAVRPSS